MRYIIPNLSLLFSLANMYETNFKDEMLKFIFSVAATTNNQGTTSTSCTADYLIVSAIFLIYVYKLIN